MAPADPCVSVLLPVRDALPFLDGCLSSLVAQTWTDFEIVAVDDGSRDGSSELLDEWACREARIRVFHRPASGLVDSLNFGLDRCSGTWMARMDADDLCEPARLRLQIEAFTRDPSLDVVSCLVSHFPQSEVGEGFRVYEEWLNSLVEHEQILRERFVESPLAHPSVMVPKELLKKAGGYRDEGWPEDYDL